LDGALEEGDPTRALKGLTESGQLGQANQTPRAESKELDLSKRHVWRWEVTDTRYFFGKTGCLGSQGNGMKSNSAGYVAWLG
jgi:hypothetical protein